MSETYVVSAVRTAIGRFGGSLKDVSPVDLGAHVMKAAIDRAGIEAKELDMYIFGNILKHGHGQLVPRHAALKAGIPADVDGYALDMLCSSGMMSVMNADTAIRAGDADLILAGGIESMSQAGFVLSAPAGVTSSSLVAQPNSYRMPCSSTASRTPLQASSWAKRRTVSAPSMG